VQHQGTRGFQPGHGDALLHIFVNLYRHTHSIPSTLLNQRLLGRYEFKVGSGGGGQTCEQENNKTAVVLAQVLLRRLRLLLLLTVAYQRAGYNEWRKAGRSQVLQG
jgi:hypothetical protein